MAQNPYTELGVSKTAEAGDVRKAFHKLAKKLHPDQNPGDKAAEERFKRVTAAFDLLGDAEKRAKFDRGEIDADGRETARAYAGDGGGGFGARAGGFEGFRPGGGGAGARFEGVDLDDILSDIMGRREGAPRGFGGGRGGDLRAKLEIDLEDVISGATRRISFADGRNLDVTIPKGAHEGQVLRLRGQGQPSKGGGAAGDALIELSIRPHPVFRVEGANLHMDLPVSVPDAVLGAKIDAPTPDGGVTLTVPKGSNSGAVLRLKGRGAIESGTAKRGDLFARLVVTLPEMVDDNLRTFAEEWREMRPYTPRRR